tara:strand:- start:1151 stop:1840 length:690 start_codon:yes stop_codon:yes gene_type:complete
MGGGVGKIIGGVFGAANADKELRRVRGEKAEAKFGMENARANRQEIINPYAGITDLSGLAKDLSSQITNPFNQITVSTAAAEMQAEESDIALANTLDTLEQTGASAGGATALAMAALKSKKDVAATIEQQEATNSKLRAEGEAQMNREKVAAKQTAQQAQIQLKGRKEEADAKGEIFQFQAQEARTNQDINMYQSMYLGLSEVENNLREAKADAIGDVFGGISGIFKKD